jgi:hypothetical protein
MVAVASYPSLTPGAGLLSSQGEWAGRGVLLSEAVPGFPFSPGMCHIPITLFAEYMQTDPSNSIYQASHPIRASLPSWCPAPPEIKDRVLLSVEWGSGLPLPSACSSFLPKIEAAFFYLPDCPRL